MTPSLAAEPAAGPPAATGGVRNQTTKLSLWSATWTRALNDDLCVTQIADGIPVFSRRPLRVQPGSQFVHLVFDTPQRPRKITAFAWNEVDENDLATGKRKRLVVDVGRIGEGQAAQWQALIPLTINRDRYLGISGRWPVVGCGGGANSASWILHLAPRH